jgi:hypothetical protein
MKEAEGSATIRELPTLKALLPETKADLYVETGKTGGRTFLITINHDNERPTLVALHL